MKSRRSILGTVVELSSVPNISESIEENRIDLEQELISMITKSHNELIELWSKMGLTDKACQDRTRTLITYHADLQKQMVDEETWLYEKLMLTVDDLKSELCAVRKQLKLPEPELLDVDIKGLLQEEFHLKGKVEELHHVKYDRLEKLVVMLAQESELCETLNMPPINNGTARTGDYDIDDENVPSEEQLKEVQQHIEMLLDEKTRRLDKFTHMRGEILQLLENLELQASTEFQQSVVANNIKMPSFLSQDKLNEVKNWLNELGDLKDRNEQTIKALHNRLTLLWDGLGIEKEERDIFTEHYPNCGKPTISAYQRQIEKFQEIKKQNIGKFVDRLREELLVWWEKCFASSSDRENFVAYKDETLTEDLLELHEREVMKWKQMYEDNKAIYSKIVRRNELWEQKKIYDKKSNDPSRFQNRGGNLLAEEKARKRLEHDIPKLDTEIQTMIDEWEFMQEIRETLLIHGLSFKAYTELQRETLKLEIENDKKLRAVKKTEGGKKLVTPTKRKAASARNTPASVAKNPRLNLDNENFLTPMTMGNTVRSPAVIIRNAAAARSSPRKGIHCTSPVKQITKIGSHPANDVPRLILNEIQEDEMEQNYPRPSMTYNEFREELKNKDDGVFNSTTTTAILEAPEKI